MFVSYSLSDVCLSGISLSGVSLSDVCLSGVSLSDVCLSGVSLSDVCLSGVSLSDVCLSGVSLSDVCLSGVSLSDVCLSDVCLSGVCLSDVYQSITWHLLHTVEHINTTLMIFPFALFSCFHTPTYTQLCMSLLTLLMDVPDHIWQFSELMVRTCRKHVICSLITSDKTNAVNGQVLVSVTAFGSSKYVERWPWRIGDAVFLCRVTWP